MEVSSAKLFWFLLVYKSFHYSSLILCLTNLTMNKNNEELPIGLPLIEALVESLLKSFGHAFTNIRTYYCLASVAFNMVTVGS